MLFSAKMATQSPVDAPTVSDSYGPISPLLCISTFNSARVHKPYWTTVKESVCTPTSRIAAARGRHQRYNIQAVNIVVTIWTKIMCIQYIK